MTYGNLDVTKMSSLTLTFPARLYQLAHALDVCHLLSSVLAPWTDFLLRRSNCCPFHASPLFNVKKLQRLVPPPQKPWKQYGWPLKGDLQGWASQLFLCLPLLCLCLLGWKPKQPNLTLFVSVNPCVSPALKTPWNNLRSVSQPSRPARFLVYYNTPRLGMTTTEAVIWILLHKGCCFHTNRF